MKLTLKQPYPIPFVDNLEILELEKRGHLWLSTEDLGNELTRHFLLVLFGLSREPLLQPELALTAEQKHELDLKNTTTFLDRFLRSS